MIRPAHDAMRPAEADTRTMAIAIALLGIAFFVAEHDPGRSRLETLAASADEMGSYVASGDLRRQIGFSAIGALGLVFLLRRQGRPLRVRDPLAWLVVAFAAWCAASPAWSDDAALTVKRVAVTGLCFLGALGTARQLSPRQVCILTLVVVGAYSVIGLIAEMALGTFRPWSGDYRFAGTVHPNSQGVQCAVICLAALALAGRPHRGRRWPLVLFAAGAVLLLLTRSRTSCAALAVALGVVALLRTSGRARLLGAVGGVAVVSAALLACDLWLPDLRNELTKTILLGRTEGAESLSGRIPLWTDLLGYAGRRPLLGYGFNSFWSARHIEEVSEALEWAICSAHSMYLDTLLSVGLIGTVLFVVAGAAGTCRLAARYLASGETGYGFLTGLLVFGAALGVLESSFVQPWFVPTVALCAMAHAAFYPQEQCAP